MLWLPASSQVAVIRGLVVPAVRIYRLASSPCAYLCLYTSVPAAATGTCTPTSRMTQWDTLWPTRPGPDEGSSWLATAPTAPDKSIDITIALPAVTAIRSTATVCGVKVRTRTAIIGT